MAGGRSSHAIATLWPSSVARLELRRPLLLPARVGLGVGEEALPRLDPQPSLGHQPPQDPRRLVVGAPLRLRALERGQHLVEADLVGAGERRRDDPGPGHHAQVDLAQRGDPLLEHETRLDERLEREAIDELRARGARSARGAPLASSAPVLIETLSGLGAEIAGCHEIPHPLMDIEAIAVALVEVLGHVQDRVETEEVGQEERPHRRGLGLGDQPVDLLDVDPLLLLRAPQLGHTRVEDPVDDEPRTLGAADRHLPDPLGEAGGGLSCLGRRVVALDHLDQAHDRRWIEEVKADDLVRAAGRVAHLGDRQRGGVGGEDRVAGRHLVELGEDRLLDVHPLGHGLDHDVDVAEPLVVGRCRGSARACARARRAPSCPARRGPATATAPCRGPGRRTRS